MIHRSRIDTPGRDQLHRLLYESPYFSGASQDIFEKLLACTTKERFEEGDVIVTEGEIGNCVYLILEGSTQVTLHGELLAKLSAGDWIGTGLEKLIPDNWTRTATVTALEPTRALRISADAFNKLIETHPDLKEKLSSNRDKIIFHHFIKDLSLFNSLSHSQIEKLYHAIEKIKVDENTVLLTQGEESEQCYFIYDGTVDVTIDSPAKVIATLRSGQVFGEMSLLAEEACNATVTTTTPCQLLVLKKQDLENVLLECATFSETMSSFLLQRSRPVKAEHIDVLHRHSQDGQDIILLKNTKTLDFFQLSIEGFFVWERLDGNTTLRELIEEYLIHFKTLNLAHVSNIIMRLSVAGFVHIPTMAMAHMEKRIPLHKRIACRLKKIFEANVIWPNASEKITRLFHTLKMKTLYTPVTFVIMLVLGFSGFFFFLSTATESLRHLMSSPLFWLYIACILPIRFISIVLHELGHAFMTLRYKQPLKSVGFGWHWFTPIAYIDTSSMWGLSKGPRIMVDLAGILSDWAFAGLLLTIACLSRNTTFITLTFLFGLSAYINILINLNPLLKLDGYYLLMDTLDEPNLRSKSAAWLSNLFRRKVTYSAKHVLYWGFSGLYIASIISILYTLLSI